MPREYTAIIKKNNNWWIGWIEEVPGVNCQEHSKEELIESLKEILKEALELNRQESLSIAGSDYLEEKIAL
jgi:predicted RNase H-like HicB family nuclease